MWTASVAAALVILSSISPASAADSKPPSFNPWVTSLKLILSLGLIVVLAVVLIRWLAKRAQVEQKGGIQILAARQLAPNKSVQVVDVQGRTLVLGVGDDVTLLADVTTVDTVDGVIPAPPSTVDSAATPFATMLADTLKTLRDKHRRSAPGSSDGGMDS